MWQVPFWLTPPQPVTYCPAGQTLAHALQVPLAVAVQSSVYCVTLLSQWNMQYVQVPVVCGHRSPPHSLRKDPGSHLAASGVHWWHVPLLTPPHPVLYCPLGHTLVQAVQVPLLFLPQPTAYVPVPVQCLVHLSVIWSRVRQYWSKVSVVPP